MPVKVKRDHRRRNRGGQGGHGPPNNLSANAAYYCVFKIIKRLCEAVSLSRSDGPPNQEIIPTPMETVIILTLKVLKMRGPAV